MSLPKFARKPKPSSSQQITSLIVENANPQTRSPLFTTIPPEVRNVIFAACCLPHYDDSHEYDPIGYVSRPGYRFPLTVKTAMNLLRTCRLVYFEAHKLPMAALKEVTFWGDRGPTHENLPQSNWRVYFSPINKIRADLVERIQLFAQLYYLEGDQFRAFASEVHAKSLTITVRHTDWWFWESNERLRLKKDWIEHLKAIKGLVDFTLELETMERDKAQMLAIARTFRSQKIQFSGGRLASAEHRPIQEWSWKGPTMFESQPDGMSGYKYNRPSNAWVSVRPKDYDRTDPAFTSGMVYCVAKVRWIVQ
ncbi:hypothetical protein DL96DRAFT_1457262 [Flagelloscypha sp. PMI_526]|nr:hypothetical protein DL96DRAFT_1457262 [Flagelloscypha sp. PMI_526]